MTIESAGIPSQILAEYAAIPIAFEVTSILSAQNGRGGSSVLEERRLASPYVKDYDAVGDRPLDWPARFDTSQWVLFVAQAEGRQRWRCNRRVRNLWARRARGPKRSGGSLGYPRRAGLSRSGRWPRIVRSGRSMGRHARLPRVESRNPEYQRAGMSVLRGPGLPASSRSWRRLSAMPCGSSVPVVQAASGPADGRRLTIERAAAERQDVGLNQRKHQSFQLTVGRRAADRRAISGPRQPVAVRLPPGVAVSPRR